MVAKLLHGSSASLEGGVSGRTRPKRAAQLYPKGLVDFPPGAASRLSSVLQTASLHFWPQAVFVSTFIDLAASGHI